jgi:3-oxoacyl-[acyl-carrier-protein] synthase III
MIAAFQSTLGMISVGSAVPERVVTNAELAAQVDTNDEWITSRTGIRERRVAGDDEYASDLALAAALDALDRCEVPPAAIDLVICATSTPDSYFPSVASQVADRIGAHAAAAFDLGAACTGFVYALSVAAAHLHSGMSQNALVIGSETMSRIVDWSDRSTCVLFGDGAAATVLAGDASPPRLFAVELGADGSRGDDLIVRALRGEPKTIEMNGREVFKFATRVIVDSASRLLAATGVAVADVDWWVPHQANSRIIDYAVRRLGIEPHRVLMNVDRYGNTSAASIPLCLDEAWRQGRLNRDDRLMIVGFGGGLTWGSCLTHWAGPTRAREGAER